MFISCQQQIKHGLLTVTQIWGHVLYFMLQNFSNQLKMSSPKQVLATYCMKRSKLMKIVNFEATTKRNKKSHARFIRKVLI
jgi:hypothetical protein